MLSDITHANNGCGASCQILFCYYLHNLLRRLQTIWTMALHTPNYFYSHMSPLSCLSLLQLTPLNSPASHGGRAGKMKVFKKCIVAGFMWHSHLLTDPNGSPILIISPILEQGGARCSGGGVGHSAFHTGLLLGYIIHFSRHGKKWQCFNH